MIDILVFLWRGNNIGIFFKSDINECDAINGPSGRCGKNAICTNTLGGFSCQCKSGFSGNAFKQCLGMF